MQTQSIELTRVDEGTQAASIVSLTAERWRLHGGVPPADNAAGALHTGQTQGLQATLGSQCLVLRTVGAQNVEGMDFATVADLIKAAGRSRSYHTKLRC